MGSLFVPTFSHCCAFVYPISLVQNTLPICLAIETLPFFQSMVRKSPAPGSPLQPLQVRRVPPHLLFFAAGTPALTPVWCCIQLGPLPRCQLLKLGKGLTQLCLPL